VYDAMPELLAVYGTLRRGGRLHAHLGTSHRRTRFVGMATITGHLYEVSPGWRDPGVGAGYPCFVPAPDGQVVVDVFEVLDATLWSELDDLEGVVPDDPTAGEYVRSRVALHDLSPSNLIEREAWTYVYVRTVPHRDQWIPGGDWIAAQDPGSSYL
jgi:gamma-glutamylcyclotransferase (GGCT)/AIG2-like uncharacterized protein YtfP